MHHSSLPYFSSLDFFSLPLPSSTRSIRSRVFSADDRSLHSITANNSRRSSPGCSRFLISLQSPSFSWKIDARRSIVRGTKFAETMDRRREEKKRRDEGEYKKIESRAACDINGCCGRGLSGMEEEIKGEAKKKRKRVHRKRFQPFLTISSRRSRERSKYL